MQSFPFPPPPWCRPPVMRWPKPEQPYALKIEVDAAKRATEEVKAGLSEHENNGTIHVTAENKAAWNGKYEKPAAGIPRSDLAYDVKASLAKADTALQQHQSLDGYATEEWVGEKGFLTEHQDITGKADLVGGKVPSSQLPSYVDDVLENDSRSAFPATGEAGKIYVAKDTNKTYRWSGTQYVEIAAAPVTSVNNKTGAVVLSASDVGAASDTALANHVGDSVKHVTAAERAEWNGKMPGSATGENIPIDDSHMSISNALASVAGRFSDYRTASEQDAIDSAQNTAIAAKYTKPSGGIPASDLAAGVIPAVPVKAVKRNGTALTPDANGAVNVEVPVTSVNGKTGAVELDGSSIPISDAATTTVLGAFQQVFLTANSKQDAISDLATIRSGAAAGATAVQPAGLANYVQKSQTAGLLKNDGTVDTNTYLTAHQDISGKLDAAQRNMLVYASTTTLVPQTAVYRSSLNADGTFPTITATAIPTAAAYYQFELEMTVPSTVPSTITGPSGWTWLDGHGLPDPADLSGGETICVSVRLDCTVRTFLASVWRVA